MIVASSSAVVQELVGIINKSFIDGSGAAGLVGSKTPLILRSSKTLRAILFSGSP
jgi:hypothetical protein